MRDWREAGVVTIVTFNKSRRVFPSLREAVLYAGKKVVDSLRYMRLGLDPIQRFGPATRPRYPWNNAVRDWVPPLLWGDSHVFLDELDMPIPAWRVRDEYYRIPLLVREPAPRWRRHRPFSFRRGPVPGTRCWKAGGRYFRNVRTSGEHRENDFTFYDEDLEGINLRVRGSRLRGNLPTTYDDRPINQAGDGWKNYRKKQWKGS